MNKQKVYETLNDALTELDTEDIGRSSCDGTLAADIHQFYNTVGLKEGWLKPEYATVLSKQDSVTQAKNIEAAKDVVHYWISQAGEPGKTFDESLLESMIAAVMFEQNREQKHLEAAADSQHEQWKRFVAKYQPERITPENPKFRQKNYDQYNTPYANLSEQEKDQDRLVVAVITDRILKRADRSYEAVIKF